MILSPSVSLLEEVVGSLRLRWPANEIKTDFDALVAQVKLSILDSLTCATSASKSASCSPPERVH